MQWLVHGSVGQESVDQLVELGHTVHALSEVNLSGESAMAEVVTAAMGKQWDLITTESTLGAAIFDEGLKFTRSVVYLQNQGEDSIERLFARYKRLTPGRMYTVTESRVKIRQLPRGIGNRGSGRSSPGERRRHTPEPEHPSR